MVINSANPYPISTMEASLYSCRRIKQEVSEVIFARVCLYCMQSGGERESASNDPTPDQSSVISHQPEFIRIHVTIEIKITHFDIGIVKEVVGGE